MNLAMASISGDVSTPTICSASGKALMRARVENPTPQQRSSTLAFSLRKLADNSSATCNFILEEGGNEWRLSVGEAWWQTNEQNKTRHDWLLTQSIDKFFSPRTYPSSNVHSLVGNVINHLGRDRCQGSMQLQLSATRNNQLSFWRHDKEYGHGNRPRKTMTLIVTFCQQLINLPLPWNRGCPRYGFDCQTSTPPHWYCQPPNVCMRWHAAWQR